MTMLFLIAISLFCFVTFPVQGTEYLPVRSKRAYDVCYDEYGCFTTGAPFGGTLQRPFTFLPDRPEAVGTTFYLYTRTTRKAREEVSRRTTIGTWNVTRPTKFVIHGFLDSPNKPWWLDMKNAILAVEDVNVIMVDWSKGNGFPYTKAAANTQIVGAEVALFINYLIEEHGAKATDFHVIGHSLGGQTAGYVGERVKGLGRITGLDPAGPYFENTDTKVHLDLSDALFVDVIHTDGAHNLLLGLGTLQRMGHVDFYPNGGYDQPNCPKTVGKVVNLILQVSEMDIKELMETTICSHLAAVHFFTDTIRNQCPYIGYSCTNFDDFNAGKCSLQCDGDQHQCNRMGYWASPTGGRGNLYLKTQNADQLPFCYYHNQITLQSGSEFLQTRGIITLTLIGTMQTTSIIFDNDETVFQRNSIETRFIPLTIDIGEITEVKIDFQKTKSWIYSPLFSSLWSFTKVTILQGDQQYRKSFCPDQSIITSASNARYLPC